MADNAPRLRRAAALVAAVSAAFCAARTVAADGFTPPDAAERLRAIGPTDGLDNALQRAFRPDERWRPIDVPGEDDWLSAHEERGQTFEDYMASRPNRPRGSRQKIYLLPLGTFESGASPKLDLLEACAASYFALETVVLPAQPLEDPEVRAITSRRSTTTGKLQLLTGDVLAYLRKRLPRDAFCLLGITMVDLYPDPAWNFVFGQASLRQRVGVYSFARYDPAFFGDRRAAGYRTTLLRRSCKVLVHETAHMFGLRHCIFFNCALNGSNHLRESDARPMALCPVCLRKLQANVGFDVVKRYRALERFYRRASLVDERRWVERGLKALRGDGDSARQR